MTKEEQLKPFSVPLDGICLVTGAGGGVGSHLVEWLVLHGARRLALTITPNNKEKRSKVEQYKRYLQKNNKFLILTHLQRFQISQNRN